MQQRHITEDELRGFTIVECLVVLVMVGILAAILIPAVLAARRAADKSHCLNNLRQLGIALSNYSSTFNSFPPGNTRGASIQISILSYVEQTQLYNAINFRTDLLYSISNRTVASTSLSEFLCPADYQITVGRDEFAWTSYAGNRGIGVQKYGENGAFAFPPGVTVAVGDFTDGTSSTVAIAEWSLGNGPREDRDPRKATFHTRPKLPAPEEFDRFSDLCHNIDISSAKTNSNHKGLNWMHGEFGKTLYNHTLAPNDHTCLNGSGYQIGAWTAGSSHPGGVNVLFADSNVHFIRETIALPIWRAIGSRNGSEIVSQDSY